MSTVMKISHRVRSGFLKKIMQTLNIEKGDYVEMESDRWQIILRPRKLIDPTLSWHWTKKWQKMEGEVDKEIEKNLLSPEFRTAEEGLKWLKE